MGMVNNKWEPTAETPNVIIMNRISREFRCLYFYYFDMEFIRPEEINEIDERL